MRFLAAVAFAAAAFFIIVSLVWFKRRRSMTLIERANYQIEEATRNEQRRSPMERFRLYLTKNGYRGDLTPVLVAITVLYLVLVLLLRGIGVGSWYGPIAALPLSVAAVWYTFIVIAAKRRKRFNRQLLDALKLIAGQIESGNGPQRAIEQTIPSLQEPIRSELSRAMEATVASKDLVGAMKDLEEKYPSKALKMFIAALEIDRDKGGRVEPALRQAANILQRDFEVHQEAVAEIATAKYEFYAIVGLIGFIVFMIVSGGGSETRAALTSLLGIIVLSIAGANFALGIWRAMNIFRKAKGE